MADAGPSPRRPSLSAEIGPPLFPDREGVVAAAAAGGGLFKALFGRPPANSHSTIVANTSFNDLPFVGGQDDAEDAWRDKWEARDKWRVAPTVGVRTGTQESTTNNEKTKDTSER